MNQIVTRRALLRTTALIPVGLAVEGCAALTTAVTLAPQIAEYAGVIANAISLVLPDIKALTGLAGGAYNTIAWVVDQISGTATKIANATSADAASLVSTLASGVGTIAGMLSGLPSLSGIVNDVISNALAVIPRIEALVGIAPSAPPVTAHRFARMAATVSPELAVANLRVFVASRR